MRLDFMNFSVLFSLFLILIVLLVVFALKLRGYIQNKKLKAKRNNTENYANDDPPSYEDTVLKPPDYSSL